jgi:hypothetical protein
VQSILKIGLTFQQSSPTLLSVFLNADLAGCLDATRFTGGFAIVFGPNLIS